MIFNEIFLTKDFSKSGPLCGEGSIWRGKNKTSPLK